MQAEPPPPPSDAPPLPASAGLRKGQEEDGKQRDVTTPNASVMDVTRPASPPSLTPALTSPAASVYTCEVEAESKKQTVEEKVGERTRNVKEEPQKKPLWLDDDDLPPMM